MLLSYIVHTFQFPSNQCFRLLLILKIIENIIINKVKEMLK